MIDLNVTVTEAIEDTQTIDSDIDSLYSKFIKPIDNFRSIGQSAMLGTARSQTTQKTGEATIAAVENFNGLETNTLTPLESRASAFYRMIGLPTMDASGNFYNPGFNPVGKKNILNKENIDKKIAEDQDLSRTISERELLFKEKAAIFSKSTSMSAAYALALRFSKKFNLLNPDLKPLELDLQRFEISERRLVIDKIFNSEYKNYGINDKSIISGRHILRPFIVSPVIESTVTPEINKVCAPFLATENDTKINPRYALKRPGIEYICRLRLVNTEPNLVLKKRIEGIVGGKIDASLDELVAAISKDNSSAADNPELMSVISGFSQSRYTTLSTLVKTINVVAKQLVDAQGVIDAIEQTDSIMPYPNAGGPEYGSKFSFMPVGGGSYEQNLKTLEMLNASNQLAEQIKKETLGGGDEIFATTPINNAQVDFTPQINNIKRHLNTIENKASNAYKTIEIITGEISGLGLIDVLAIYAALWAIDEKTLVSLLDDESFNRLYDNNPRLRSASVIARKNSGDKYNGLEAMEKFETMLMSLLSYADAIVESCKRNPLERNTGTPV